MYKEMNGTDYFYLKECLGFSKQEIRRIDDVCYAHDTNVSDLFCELMQDLTKNDPKGLDSERRKLFFWFYQRFPKKVFNGGKR